MLELLQYPFIQRAIIAGVILALVFAVLGSFVILRKMAFWGEGIAHASLAGIALALFAGYNPLFMAIVVAILFAFLIFILERKTKLSNDAIIGVLFTSFMALGVIILSLQKGYQPELLSYLFGNILTVGSSDVLIMSLVGVAILACTYYFRKELALITFDRESAYLQGIATDALDLAFYIMLAVAVVLGVKLLGIILVSALLLIPASTAKILARSYSQMQWISIVIAEVVMISGLLLSFSMNIPSGPTVILTGAVVFLVATVFRGRH